MINDGFCANCVSKAESRNRRSGMFAAANVSYSGKSSTDGCTTNFDREDLFQQKRW